MTAYAVEVMEVPPDPPAPRSSLRSLLWPSLVAELAVALRLPYFTRRSIWYDEASSWQTAKFALPELMRSVRLNVHMPLYYILLKGWMFAFGDSVAALRGFSVTFGALTVLVMVFFGDELYRASAASDSDSRAMVDARARVFGLCVGALVALSPCQVFASIEARMYSLGTFLAALSAWLLLRVIREGTRSRLWWAYGLAFAALPYAHHYGLFTAAAQMVFLGLYVAHLTATGDRKTAAFIFRRAVVVAVAALVAYLPGLDVLRAQTDRVRQDYWVRPLSWTIFFGTFNEFILPRPDYDQLSNGWVSCAGFIVSCLVVARRARRGDAFVLALVVVPMGLSAAASTITPVWVGRYFRFTQLFVLSTVALAAWRLSGTSKWLRIGLFTAIYAGLMAASGAFWKGLDLENGQGVKGAVEYIEAHLTPGESVVALDATQYFPAKLYLGRRAKVRMVEPAVDLFWGWHLIRANDLVTLGELDDELGRGVWLVSTMPNPALTPALAAQAPIDIQLFTYYNHLHAHVWVHHYQKRGSRRP
jgi:mannosyltransferase